MSDGSGQERRGGAVREACTAGRPTGGRSVSGSAAEAGAAGAVPARHRRVPRPSGIPVRGRRGIGLSFFFSGRWGETARERPSTYAICPSATTAVTARSTLFLLWHRAHSGKRLAELTPWDMTVNHGSLGKSKDFRALRPAFSPFIRNPFVRVKGGIHVLMSAADQLQARPFSGTLRAMRSAAATS